MILQQSPAPAEEPLCERSLPKCAPRAVLDTNTAFDWLLFDDPHASPMAHAILAGRLQWIASSSMRCEFVHVLRRGMASARGRDTATLVSSWDCHANIVPEPPPQPLQCTDPDDQCFIDLAIFCRARWLFTRDKALLRLARRAVTRGVEIIAPSQWKSFSDK